MRYMARDKALSYLSSADGRRCGGPPYRSLPTIVVHHCTIMTDLGAVSVASNARSSSASDQACLEAFNQRQRLRESHGQPREVLGPRRQVARFEVRHSVSGSLVNVGCKVSTRIFENTTLEWLLPVVAEALEVDLSGVRLVVGDTVCEYHHRIAGRSQTFLRHYVQDPEQQEEAKVLVSVVIRDSD